MPETVRLQIRLQESQTFFDGFFSKTHQSPPFNNAVQMMKNQMKFVLYHICLLIGGYLILYYYS